MRHRLVRSSLTVVVLLGATFVAGAVPAAAVAPCQPLITVLPLPVGASGGSVTAAVPGLAVGTVSMANRVNRAVSWRLVRSRWVVKQIPGVAALGATTVSWATGVNRHGAITLNAVAAGSYAWHAYVAADGVLHPLLDGARRHDAWAEDISDSGRVVGSAYSEPEALQIPVRWDYWDQIPRGLGWGYPGFSNTATAVDVNDDIAGYVNFGAHWGSTATRVDGDGHNQALTNGPADGGSEPQATALDLNSSERTVGYGSSAAGNGAMIWDSGAYTYLPHLPGNPAPANAQATAVSESGTVVGNESELTGSETPPRAHVLFWTDTGGLRSLLPASGRWTDSATARDVTDDGSVYGSSMPTSGAALRPTVWACAQRQAFVPTAAGVPAGMPRPDVVHDNS